jgi:hypothetical protein
VKNSRIQAVAAGHISALAGKVKERAGTAAVLAGLVVVKLREVFARRAHTKAWRVARTLGLVAGKDV